MIVYEDILRVNASSTQAQCESVFPYIFGSNQTATNQTNHQASGGGVFDVTIENYIVDKDLNTYVALVSTSQRYFDPTLPDYGDKSAYRGLAKVSGGSAHAFSWKFGLTKTNFATNELTVAVAMTLRGTEADGNQQRHLAVWYIDKAGYAAAARFNKGIVRIFLTTDGSLEKTFYVPTSYSIEWPLDEYINNGNAVFTASGKTILAFGIQPATLQQPSYIRLVVADYPNSRFWEIQENSCSHQLSTHLTQILLIEKSNTRDTARDLLFVAGFKIRVDAATGLNYAEPQFFQSNMNVDKLEPLWIYNSPGSATNHNAVIVGMVGYNDGDDVYLAVVTQRPYLAYTNYWNLYNFGTTVLSSEPMQQRFHTTYNSGDGEGGIQEFQKDGGYRSLYSTNGGQAAATTTIEVLCGVWSNVVVTSGQPVIIWLLLVDEKYLYISIVYSAGEVETRMLEQTGYDYQLIKRMDISYWRKMTDAATPLIFVANTQQNKGIVETDGSSQLNWVGTQGVIFGFDKDNTKTCLSFNSAIMDVFNQNKYMNSSGHVTPLAVNQATTCDGTVCWGQYSALIRDTSDCTTNYYSMYPLNIAVTSSGALHNDLYIEYNDPANYNTVQKQEVLDPENGLTHGSQMMTYCQFKHPVYDLNALKSYFSGDLKAQNKPQVGFQEYGAQHLNQANEYQMKVKMGYVCPSSGCVTSSAFCGYPQLTRQTFDFSISDFFTNETLDSHAQVEGDYLIFNRSTGHDWGSKVQLFGTYRVSWKMKLADDPSSYIAELEYLMEASPYDLMNRAETCDDYGKHQFLQNTNFLPSIGQDGQIHTVNISYPIHTYPVTCRFGDLHFHIKLNSGAYEQITNGSLVLASKVDAAGSFFPQKIQKYSGYKVVDYQGAAFDNSTDDKYFKALLSGDIRVQLDLRMQPQEPTQAEIFYQAVLSNFAQSSRVQEGSAHGSWVTEGHLVLIEKTSDVYDDMGTTSSSSSNTCMATNKELTPWWEAEITSLWQINRDQRQGSDLPLPSGTKVRVQGIYFATREVFDHFPTSEVYLDDQLCGKIPNVDNPNSWHYVSCNQMKGSKVKLQRVTPGAVHLSFCGIYVVVSKEEGDALIAGESIETSSIDNTTIPYPFGDRTMTSTSFAFLQDYTSLYSDSATHGSSAYNSSNLKKITLAVSATGKYLCTTSDCQDYTGYQAYAQSGSVCQTWTSGYASYGLPKNYCRNPGSDDVSIWCWNPNSWGYGMYCVNAADVDTTIKTEQELMVYSECLTVTPTAAQTTKLVADIAAQIFVIDPDTSKYHILQSNNGASRDIAVAFPSPNQCIKCNVNFVGCEYSHYWNVIEKDWIFSYGGSDGKILSSSLSADSTTLTVTFNFTEADLHPSQPQLTPLKLRFNHSNTLFQNTYTFENDFAVGNICPSTCEQKWLSTEEAFNFSIQSHAPNNIYDNLSFEIDTTDYTSCQFYNLSIVDDVQTIKDLSQNNTKFTFQMNPPFQLRGTTTVVLIQTHSNCWGQTKLFTLTIAHIEKPEPIVVQVVEELAEEDAVDIEDKLVATPESQYDLILGQANQVQLGLYQGDKTDKIFASYAVGSTSSADLETSLADAFIVTSEYKSERLTLNIDLSAVDPLFADSTVSGELTIMTMNNEQILYPIAFKLVCESDSTYCSAVVEDEADGSLQSDSVKSDSADSKNTGSENEEVSADEDFYDDEDYEDEYGGEYDEEEDYGDEEYDEEEYGEEGYYGEEEVYDDEGDYDDEEGDEETEEDQDGDEEQLQSDTEQGAVQGRENGSTITGNKGGVSSTSSFKGVNIQDRDNLLAKQAALKKLKQKKKPALKKVILNPAGQILVQFTQKMKLIKGITKRNLGKMMKVSLTSFEFEKKLVGKWMRKPSGKNKRKLNKRSSAAKKKNRRRLTRFRWFADKMEAQEIVLQMVFDNPSLISRLSEGQDSVQFQILNKNYFKAEDSNLKLDSARSQEVKGSLPQQLNKKSAARVKESMQQATAAVASGGILTIIVAKLSGGGLQAFWGMISVLQEVSFNALINIKYPPTVSYQQQMMMTFAKLDVGSIDWFWQDNFQFVETRALNNKFELSGMETQNFLFNSGSLLPNCFAGISQSCFFVVFTFLLLKHQRNRYFRILMKKTVAPPVKMSIIQLLYQFTTDAIICSLLQFRAYAELGFAVFFTYGIEFLNLGLSILFLAACLGVSIFAIRLIQKTEDLELKEFQRQYSIFIDGLKTNSKITAQYHNLVIVKKIIQSMILIMIQQGCIQTQILLFVSSMYMNFVFGFKPFEKNADNILEKFNETIIYLTLICQFSMSDPSVPTKFLGVVGTIYGCLCILAIVGNFSIQAKLMYEQLQEYRQGQVLKKKYMMIEKELKKQCETNKDSLVLKRKLEEAKVVSSCFEVKELKNLLEDNGHDYKPFVRELIKDIMNSKKAMELVNSLAEEKRKSKADEDKQGQKRLKNVKTYMKMQNKHCKEVNSITDKENIGQNENFEKDDYQFDMNDSNRIQFKPSYKQKKKQAFGRMQTRRNRSQGKKQEALKTIEEEQESSQTSQESETNQYIIRKLGLPTHFDKDKDPKQFFKNDFIKKIVHQKKREKYLKIVKKGYRLASDLKTNIFSEASGHKVQNDKIVSIRHECDKVITKDKLKANRHMVFAGTYSMALKAEARGLMGQKEEEKSQEEEIKTEEDQAVVVGGRTSKLLKKEWARKKSQTQSSKRE